MPRRSGSTAAIASPRTMGQHLRSSQKPNILAVADNIETIKLIVQSDGGIAIVPRACAENEIALGLLKALSIAPARNVAFSLFRRREPMSRRKEAALLKMREMLKA